MQNAINMASITIRNLPNELLVKIKEKAQSERRSFNNEVIHLLEKSMITKNTPSKEQFAEFKKYSVVDEDFLSAVEEIVESRTYGKDISFE